jgi:hypothetical protein
VILFLAPASLSVKMLRLLELPLTILTFPLDNSSAWSSAQLYQPCSASMLPIPASVSAQLHSTEIKLVIGPVFRPVR